MNLYRISQDENSGYDTHDSAVVTAISAKKAAATHPQSGGEFGSQFSTWASSPDKVTVKYLGKAKPGTKAGVVCASFNAG